MVVCVAVAIDRRVAVVRGIGVRVRMAMVAVAGLTRMRVRMAMVAVAGLTRVRGCMVVAAMAMAMVISATEEPGAHNVDTQAHHCNWNRFVKRYSHWVEEAFNRLIPD
jgi:hypothetical protein